MDNDHMISKFDRAVAGLQGGNNLAAKATTIEHIDPILGEAETYIIQTVRDQKGDHVIVKFVDKEGVKRLILPPKVTGTIVRQRDALTARSRSNTAKATAKARKDRYSVQPMTACDRHATAPPSILFFACCGRRTVSSGVATAERPGIIELRR
jgi:hypothetical protein